MIKEKKYQFLFLIIILNCVASVSFLSIPLPWIGMLLQIIFSLYIMKWKISRKIPFTLFLCYFLFAFLSWFFYTIFNFSELSMPSLATTSYFTFILLRFSTIFVFFISIIFIYDCIESFGIEMIINLITNIALIVSIYAIYTYFAQILSLPELIPRSRLGTSGEEQSVSFTSAGINLKRALGTFREPSHLAEWLMLPLAITFVQNTKRLNFKKIIIVIAIILSVSLSAILSILAGLFISMILYFIVSKLQIFTKRLTQNLLFFLILIIIFTVYFSSLESNVITEVLSTRLESLFSDGLTESNRGSIYFDLKEMNISFLGYGPGNANLILTKVDGSPALVSFLSLYLNNLYSVGIIGFVFFVAILFYPIISLRNVYLKETHKYLFPFLWGYSSFLVSFFAHSEEFNLLFAFSYTFLLYISNGFKNKINDNSNYEHIKL